MKAEEDAHQSHRHQIDRFIEKNPARYAQQPLKNIGGNGDAQREPDAARSQDGGAE
jgi:hypothetical protein